MCSLQSHNVHVTAMSIPGLVMDNEALWSQFTVRVSIAWEDEV